MVRGKKRDAEARSPSGRWARNYEIAAHLGVTVMTLWRWQHDPALNFPRAHLVNGVGHTDLAQVDAWMRARPVRRGSKAQSAAAACDARGSDR